MSVYVLIVRFNFIQSSPIPIFSNKLLIFLLQRALFSFHLMSLYAIWDNLFSFLVEVRSYIGLQFSAHLHGFEKGLTGKRTLQIPTEISSLLYYSPRVNDRLDRERLSVISSVQRQCNGINLTRQHTFFTFSRLTLRYQFHDDSWLIPLKILKRIAVKNRLSIWLIITESERKPNFLSVSTGD